MPLIPFNCVFDIDYGLLDLIYSNYLDPSVFDLDWFLSHNKIKDLVLALYERDTSNPLDICLKNKSLADDLYKSFMKEKYNEILSHCISTEILNLIYMYQESKEIRPAIVYSNSLELDYMNMINGLKDISKISFSELPESIEYYQQFFFKSLYDDIYLDSLVNHIKVKTIYIANYRFNSKTDENAMSLVKPIEILLSNKNDIRIIDIYNREKLGGI